SLASWIAASKSAGWKIRRATSRRSSGSGPPLRGASTSSPRASWRAAIVRFRDLLVKESVTYWEGCVCRRPVTPVLLREDVFSAKTKHRREIAKTLVIERGQVSLDTPRDLGEPRRRNAELLRDLVSV